MPFIYTLASVAIANNFTTSSSTNTEIEHTFVKPGTRNVGLKSLRIGGKGAGLTALTGIAIRFTKWTTTAASAGTAQTPVPVDPGSQAAKATSGSTAAASVTAGTGGPTYIGHTSCGGAGPGGWVAEDPDSLPTLEGSDNKSFGVRSIAGTASMNFEQTLTIQE